MRRCRPGCVALVESAAPQTTRYLYQKYTGSNAGGAIGMAADDFQVGIYANYGDLAMNTVDNATPALAAGVPMAGVVESPPITGKTPTTSRDYWEQQSSLATRTAPSSRLMALAEGNTERLQGLETLSGQASQLS